MYRADSAGARSRKKEEVTERLYDIVVELIEDGGGVYTWGSSSMSPLDDLALRNTLTKGNILVLAARTAKTRFKDDVSFIDWDRLDDLFDDLIFSSHIEELYHPDETTLVDFMSCGFPTVKRYIEAVAFRRVTHVSLSPSSIHPFGYLHIENGDSYLRIRNKGGEHVTLDMLKDYVRALGGEKTVRLVFADAQKIVESSERREPMRRSYPT